MSFRLVGPFLTYCAENCFVIVDQQNEVCGYVLTAPDATTFFENVASRWLPSMVQKYPSHDKTVDLTPTEVSKQFCRYLIHPFKLNIVKGCVSVCLELLM